jgi:hypothetical protein
MVWLVLAVAGTKVIRQQKTAWGNVHELGKSPYEPAHTLGEALVQPVMRF